MQKSNIIIKYSLIALIFLTLAFIFGNSLVSKEESAAESETVKEWLEVILPEESVLSLFMLNNVRKIAHFIEFGVLSLELTLYALIFSKNKKNGVLTALLISFIAAFLDETIQIFSKRGSAVSDIWIDLFGVFSFCAGVLVLYFVFILFRNYRHNGESSDGQN